MFWKLDTSLSFVFSSVMLQLLVIWVIKSTCTCQEGDPILKLMSFIFFLRAISLCSCTGSLLILQMITCWAPFLIYNSTTATKKFCTFVWENMWLAFTGLGWSPLPDQLATCLPIKNKLVCFSMNKMQTCRVWGLFASLFNSAKQFTSILQFV